MASHFSRIGNMMKITIEFGWKTAAATITDRTPPEAPTTDAGLPVSSPTTRNAMPPARIAAR